MSRPMAVHVCYNLLVHFFAVLYKTSMWTDQILRLDNFYFKFIPVSQMSWQW